MSTVSISYNDLTLRDHTDMRVGDDPVGIGIRSLPIGFGIIGGAVVCLVLIPITKGRVRELMICKRHCTNCM
jgi:hypothetical protein